MNIKCIMLALVAIVAMNGCTTINIIFAGSDSGPMVMGDAGVPMGDAGMFIADDAAPMPPVDAGTDAGPTDEPTLVVNADNLRQSTILVAGGGVWHNVAQYRVRPSVDSTLQCVRVQIDGDAADIEQFAIAQDGMIMGLGILPSGTDTSTVACLSTPIAMRAMENTIFQIWVRVPAVVSGSSVSGAFDGVLRSGDRFRMGIDYVDFLATGARPATFPTIWGNEFQVRRTRPTVTRQTVSTTTLANGLDQDLYRFQVSADSAGSVAVMGFRFRMDVAGSGSVSNLRIRAGSSEIADAIVTFTGPPSNFVTVFFADERTISGSGAVFTLHGLVEGFVAGDTISISFYRDLAGTITTGYVTPGLWLDTDAGPLLTGILWSDMSEVPHSYATRAIGGSMDWTNDVYVEDLTQTQTLSR